LLVNQIHETKVIPFTGEAAIDYATKYLTRERTQESIRRSFNQMMSWSGEQGEVHKDYAPPSPWSRPGRQQRQTANPRHAPGKLGLQFLRD